MQVQRIVDFEQQHASMLSQLPEQTQELVKLRQHEAASVAGKQQPLYRDQERWGTCTAGLQDMLHRCLILDIGCGMQRITVNFYTSVACV